MPKRFLSALVCAVLLASPIAAGAPAASAARSAERLSAADFDEEYLECAGYDVRKYVTPFWETNVIWNECFYPLINNNGTYRPIKLMYRADEIVSVRDYTLTKEYVRGRDYDLNDDGELVFVSGSRIPKANDFAIHSPIIPNDGDESNYYPRRAGDGYEYWNESSVLSLKTVAVTYVTSDGNHPERPSSIAADIPRSFEKLTTGESFHIVLLGDSVGTGAKSSGNCGIAPYADAYPMMIYRALSMKYANADVQFTNSAIGGSTSGYTNARLDETVIKYSPDLVIINFGMNDSSADRVGLTDDEFRTNMTGQIEYIKSNLPDTEILLLSSLLGNPYTFSEERYVSHAAILHELAEKYDGVAVCDPQAIERFYLERKQFIDFMADNMVHPNDLGMRLTAMTVVDAFRFADLSDYVALEMSKLTERAKLDENAANGRYALLTAALADAEREMSEQSGEWDVTDVCTRYAEKINTILRQCAPEDHVFESGTRPARCGADGAHYRECAVCGYSEDVEAIPALGGEHIWDSGFVTVPSGYRAKGTRTFTCMRCGETRDEPIPELANGAQTVSDEAMMHVDRGYNYMESPQRPYVNGEGTVELDICPIDTKMGRDGVSYAGVWIANYTICASYNFTKQRFEIVDANLPYSFVSGEYKVVPYEWRSYAESGSYVWHKFAVNVAGNTVRIYCDGELVLEDTNEAYGRRTSNCVGLFYSIGEFYLDNWKIARNGYDPATGEGETLFDCGLDGVDERRDFSRGWSSGSYTDTQVVETTERTRSSARYADHVHTLAPVADVAPGCANDGCTVYECAECGARVSGRGERAAGSHAFYTAGRGTDEGGRATVVYACAYCDMTFTGIAGAASPRLAIVYDVNGDGYLNARDVIAAVRAALGEAPDGFDAVRADVNADGEVNARDVVAIMRLAAGYKWER